jgi:hypothetical protein
MSHLILSRVCLSGNDDLRQAEAALYGLSWSLRLPLVGVRGLTAEGDSPFRIIQPTGDPDQKTGSGSRVELPFHTDTAFLEDGPVEYAALLCLQGHADAKTYFVSLTPVLHKLSPSTQKFRTYAALANWIELFYNLVNKNKKRV